ncbi:MAG: SRPBCC family protein [Chthoniobacterales bacterium]|nr:SRPBCC family protein [Chthoniobacterales bacterium]
MIMNILLALGAIIVLFLVVVATRPNDFRISRSTTILAPAEAAFAQVNDLRRWQEMSPYAKLDPAAKYTFGGPRTGTGATLAWTGNKQVGEGRLTIIESRPDELVRMKLEFFKPFQVTNTAELTFEEGDTGTKVTWAMFGKSKFMCKAIGLFMNMDKMCGDSFAEGLANMKTIAEGATESRALSFSSGRSLNHGQPLAAGAATVQFN